MKNKDEEKTLYDEVNRIVSGEDSDDENHDNHVEFNNLSLTGIEQLKQLTGDRKIKIYANSFGGLNTLCSLLTKYPFLKTQGTVCICRKHIDVIIRGIYWKKERDGGELSVPLLVDVSQAEDIFHPYYIIEHDSLDIGTL